MTFDHLLLIGFGGPTQPDDIMPFLRRVVEGTRVPEERLKIVEHHYLETGGFSPYNACAQRLLDALKKELDARGLAVPAFIGMKNWHPLLEETLAQIKSAGYRRGLALVLAPHRCDASFGKYQRAVESARQMVGAAESISYDYLGPWFDQPGFIEAQADQVRAVWDPATEPRLIKTELLFSAHSIPQEMARQSDYELEIAVSAAGVAAALGVPEWKQVYQSRSGSPSQHWLEPDILRVLEEMPSHGKKRAVVVPVGFLFDHTEVLFDLDIEAKQKANALGLDFRRASTVMNHPRFVRMLADQAEKRWRA